MTETTTATFPLEDIDRVKRLAFDPDVYDAIRGLASEEGVRSEEGVSTYGPSTLTYASIEDSRIRTTSDLVTASIAPGAIERLTKVAYQGSFPSSTSKISTVKPTLSSREPSTLPTSDPSGSLAQLINRFREHPSIQFPDRVANRLEYLLAVSREEQPEQAPPSAASLEGFLAFLGKNRGIVYPDIVLTFDGNVRAEWNRGPNRHFAVEFREDEDVRFVVFAPDLKHPYKTVRVAGTATVDSVMGQARYYGAMEWMAADQRRAA